MAKRLPGWLWLATALLSVLAPAWAPGRSARAKADGADPIAVIVSERSPLEGMSLALLRRIFLGEPTEMHGRRLVPFNYEAGDPLRDHFDRIVLGFDKGTAGRYWVDRRIRGLGMPPRTLRNPALMCAVVAKLQRAIGYVRSRDLKPGVKVLQIDGHELTHRAYPLR